MTNWAEATPEKPCTCDEVSVCGYEERGVYDGILFWFCLDCGARWHRWANGTNKRLHDATAALWAKWDEAMEPSEVDRLRDMFHDAPPVPAPHGAITGSILR